MSNAAQVETTPGEQIMNDEGNEDVCMCLWQGERGEKRREEKKRTRHSDREDERTNDVERERKILKACMHGERKKGKRAKNHTSIYCSLLFYYSHLFFQTNLPIQMGFISPLNHGNCVHQKESLEVLRIFLSSPFFVAFSGHYKRSAKQNETEDKLKNWIFSFEGDGILFCFSSNRFEQKRILISSSLLLLRLIKAFLILLNDLTGNVMSDWTIANVFHGEFPFALGVGTNVRRKSEHIVQRNLKRVSRIAIRRSIDRTIYFSHHREPIFSGIDGRNDAETFGDECVHSTLKFIRSIDFD